jgi:ABC-type tungstate transport system substrate-binding protein
LNISLALVVVSIGLLLIYASDVGSSDSKFWGLDSTQRGLILGGPALVLPIIANFISKNKADMTVPILVLVCGLLIIIGGLAMGAKHIQDMAALQEQPPDDLATAQERSYDPALFEIGSLLSIGGLQIMLGIKRLMQSRALVGA